jgi:hypothetical protein
MNDDTYALRMIAIANAEIARVNLRVESMKAENTQRMGDGLSLAYTEKAFIDEEAGLNYAISLLQF